MAELVGLIASIAAIIQITGQITVFGFQYFDAVKSVPADLQALVGQLSSFNRVLQDLKECCEDNKLPTKTLRKLNDQINDCMKDLEGQLEKIKNILSELKDSKLGGKRKQFGALFKRLKWPMKASETNAIIAKIDSYKSSFTLALNVDQMSILGRIDANVQNLQGSTRDDKRMKVLEWLFVGRFDIRHNQISRERQNNTGEWLLQTPEFKEFIKSGMARKRLLWGHGIPGAGKTFLSSLVIDHLQNLSLTANYGVAHIYFNYKEQLQQKAVHVLASLVKQLACRIKRLPKPIEDLYDRLGHQLTGPTQEELYSVLLAIFGSFDEVFFVFDALDECDPGEQRGELFPLFHRMGKDGAKLFLTSRSGQDDINDTFRDTPTIELLATEQDITRYIQARLLEKKQMQRLIQRSKCGARIVPELVACANGMFLLVHFHVEYLCQQATAKQFLSALDTLKDYDTAGGIDPTYDRAIMSLKNQGKERANLGLKILSWLVKSQRPLTVDELEIAVSIEPDRYELDDLDLPDTETLLDVCASLVEVDKSSNIIRLVHYTAQEYLLRKKIIPGDSDLKVAVACTTFLLFKKFEEGACTSPALFRERIQLNPFLDYAARHLSLHINSCGKDLSTDLVMKLFESFGNTTTYLQVAYSYGNPLFLNRYPKIVLPLHIASRVGHYQTVERLLDNGADISAQAKNKETAIHLAVFGGHEEVVRLLLERGADLSIKGFMGHTPTHAALASRRLSIFRLLIDSGVSLSVKGQNGESLLHQAASQHIYSATELLLDRGADIEARNNKGWTPLHSSAVSVLSKDPIPVWRLLLDRGADFSARANGATALDLVHDERQEAMVRVLLETGADLVSVYNKHGGTNLHFAARQGYESIVTLLLDQGYDISAKDDNGETPLHLAVTYKPIVCLLLDRGADISAQDKHGWTALHAAACAGDKSMVELLLDRGADVSVRNKRGRTALGTAVDNGAEQVALILLEIFPEAEEGEELSEVEEDEDEDSSSEEEVE